MNVTFLKKRALVGVGLLLALGLRAADPASPTGSATKPSASHADAFAFIIAGDMRSFTSGAPAGKRYFDGACDAMQAVGAGEFMITPGDGDPPGPIRAVIDRHLGSNYLWYPLTGNHETEKPATMTWLRNWASNGIPHLVRRGPPGAEDTTFSFDYGNSHFVMLNEYYDGKLDNVRSVKQGFPDSSLKWLQEDLAATRQELIWIIGHKPIESLPDMDSGRVRHGNESVSTMPARLDKFLDVLKQYKVRAYLCGHTHNTSVTRVKGNMWQVDSGHARGGGDPGAPSTFVKIRVEGTRAAAEIYRADPSGQKYTLRKTVELD